MNLEELAKSAARIIAELDYDIAHENGFEVEVGWFTVHNDFTGQSKTVLYHPESGYVFKSDSYWSETPNASGRYLGEVEMLDRKFRVRLPECHNFKVDSQRIEVQEYIIGEACGCDRSWCDHATALMRVTRCSDTHQGNWKIVGDEIILFDFDGISLDRAAAN